MMTPSTDPPPLRKPNKRLGGLEVRVCGCRLRTSHNLICMFPFHHIPTNLHATIATADDGSIVAVVDDLMNEEVEMWQLVAPPE